MSDEISGFERDLPGMPDSGRGFIVGYLFANGIDQPTNDEYAQAVIALERYRRTGAAAGLRLN